MYERVIKPVLFRFDPEHMHDLFVWIGEALGGTGLGRWLTGLFCDYENPILYTRVAGIDFKNPVGLAAGFDKDMRLTKIMPFVGFGFMEIGAVTRHPYGGNEGMRLARLPEDKSLIVNYGLKSIGADAIEKKAIRATLKIPTGINIAKTNRADIKGERSTEDYASTYRLLARHFAYVTLNISCPNAQDGCMFQEPHLLDALLAAIDKEEKVCPVFLKISSHLDEHEVDEILAVAAKYRFIDGFVVGNLSKRRDDLDLKSPKEKLDQIPYGGISGRPVRELSTRLIRYIYKKTNGRYVIIGVGGIFTAKDAYEKIKAGASLVEVITGLIYGGPTVIKKINKGLVKLLARDGYANIADAVGKDSSSRIK